MDWIMVEKDPKSLVHSEVERIGDEGDLNYKFCLCPSQRDQNEFS